MGQRRIKITVGGVQVMAKLNSSRTADLVWFALPIRAQTNIWGDEIYFSTEVEIGEEDAKEVVEMWDIGYWPPGKAVCLFFGPTPVSNGDEIRPASAVNVIGKMEDSAVLLKEVHSNSVVLVEKI